MSLNNGVDDYGNAYETAGIVWSTAPTSISSVKFIQGGLDAEGNGCFTDNLSLQYSIDGTTWEESNWTVSPSYPYDNSSVGNEYTFTGNDLGGVKGIRISGQVFTNNISWRALVKEIEVTGAGGGSSSFSSTPSSSSAGTASYWSNLSSSTSNSGAVADSRLNDNNTTVEVVVPDATSGNSWQAAGMTWTSAKSNITKVEYYNGYQTNNGVDNGCFTANIKVQYSTTGTNWIDAPSGWSISPSYPYNYTSSNQVYTFTGPALPSTCRGVRVVGQVYTNNISWAIHVREVKVFNSSNVLMNTEFANSSLEQNPAIETLTTIYPNPVNNGWVNIILNGAAVNDLVAVTLTDLSGRLIMKESYIHNGQTQRLNIGNLNSGIYLINLTGANTKYASKLIVK